MALVTKEKIVRHQCIGRNGTRGKKGMIFLPKELIGKKVEVRFLV